MTKHRLQLAIYLSGLLLTLGVFLPLASFPVYGNLSYWRIAPVEACLVIAAALSAPALILTGRGKWAVLSLLGVWSVLLFPTLQAYYHSVNDTMLARAGSSMSSAMREFAADLFLNITEFQWGGLLFLFALALFTFSGLVYRVRC